MLCMTNYARTRPGLRPLTASNPLSQAAEQKSADIVGCDEFSHEACGRPFTFWDQRYGYLKGCWKAAENIAWGTGDLLDRRRDLHRLARIARAPRQHPRPLQGNRHRPADRRLEGNEGAAVWTQDFGSHKC